MKGNQGLFKPQEESFYQLLHVDTLRGEDSTGIIGVEKDTTFHIAKEATMAPWFLESYNGSKISKDMWARGKAYIGHNRKKTVGAVADETAHPFVVGDYFAMVHNGTLTNHKALADTTVDSEALAIVLAAAFAHEDYKEHLEETLGKVTGAYAVAMYDQRTNVVRLLRNSQRPLFMADTDKAWYWASEPWMLYGILGRNQELSKDSKIEAVPEDTLITFNLDKNTMGQETIKPKKAPVVSYFHGKQNGPTTTNTPVFNSEEKGDLSKNQFKRFRRSIIGTRIAFFVDDIIEENYPLTFVSGETKCKLYGECDSLEHSHIICAPIDIADYKMSHHDITKRLWYGRVNNVEYDARSKKARIFLDHTFPAPIPQRTGEIHETQSTLH